MSNSNDSLVLYLKLDDDTELTDASGKGNDGKIQGTLALVPDDTFGGCLKFDGPDGYISVPDNAALRLTGDLTIEAWVYLTQEVNDWVRIIGKGTSNQRNYGLWYHKPHKTWLFQQHGSGSTFLNVQKKVDNDIWLNTWYHLAAVRAGNKATLYLNGEPIAQQTGLSEAPPTSADPLTIGYAGYHKAHNGLIAQARLYNRALSPDEIKHDLSADKLALPAFRDAHPIAFSLFDDDNHYVLYIDDDPAAGHNLNLELHNTAAKNIQLAAGDAASAGHYHFALRFRPKILSPQTLEILKNQKDKVLNGTGDWDLYVPPETKPTDIVPLYLLYKGPEKVFAAEERRVLRLHHISAAAAGGARSTQVALRLHQLTYAGGEDAPLTGSRVQNLHITNHRGRKDIPLHVGFLGSNRILNDGSSKSDLTLHITNVIKPHREHYTNPTIALRADTAENQANGIPATHLFLAFDVYVGAGDEAGALCRASELSNDFIPQAKVVRVDNQAEETDLFDITPSAGGLTQSRQWTLVPRQDIVLRPGDTIHIDLKGLVSSLRSGPANLYLHYEDIPGYWDGQFVGLIEKAPLLFSDGKVGIGTTKPGGVLDIHTVGFNNRQADVDVASGAFPYGAERADLVLTREISENYSLNGQPASLIDFRAVYRGKTEWSTAQILSVSDLNHKGYAGGLAFLTSPGGGDNPSKQNPNDRRNNGSAPITRLVIDANGKVGIGTTSPKTKLHVTGGADATLKETSGYFVVGQTEGLNIVMDDNEIMARNKGRTSALHLQADGGDLTLHNNKPDSEKVVIKDSGKVGIGTTDPGARLEIAEPSDGVALKIGRKSGQPSIKGLGDWLILDAPTGGRLGLNYWEKGNVTIANGGGNVGIGTTNPRDILQIADYQPGDRYIKLTTQGGNQYKTGLRLWVWQDNHGFTIENNEKSPANGLHIMQHSAHNKTTQTSMFIRFGDGNVGIGTDNPSKGKLHVAGDIYCSGSIFAEGRLKYYWGPDRQWKQVENRANDFAGSYTTNGPSDLRFKTDLRPLHHALEKVLQLHGQVYRWSETGLKYFTRNIADLLSAGPEATEEENQQLWAAERQKAYEALSGDKIGLIAQEVETVVPEVVHEDEAGYKYIHYQQLTALLVEAIKEQNLLIDGLRARVEMVEKVTA